MNQAKKITSFRNLTGHDSLLKRIRYRSYSAKNKRKKFVQRLLSTMTLTTAFATSKHLSSFNNTLDFEVGSTTSVVDNCATATVLNNKDLFVGKLTPTSEYSLVTIRGSDHKPTHYGPSEITVRNNDGAIDTIPISKALHYPS